MGQSVTKGVARVVEGDRVVLVAPDEEVWSLVSVLKTPQCFGETA